MFVTDPNNEMSSTTRIAKRINKNLKNGTLSVTIRYRRGNEDF